jgi:hypothetical protein
MSTKIKYRFKTEIEFEEEFGEDWKKLLGWNINGGMNYLFGIVISEYIITDRIYSFIRYDGWWINTDMVVVVPTLIPDYRPKKFTREI